MKTELVAKYVKNLEGLVTDIGAGVSEIFIEQQPSEGMVIFLLGTVFKHLNFEDIMIKDEKKGELDAIARFEDREIIIEFEANSKHFKLHGHDPSKCNLIVCWIDKWLEPPANIDILELKYFWELRKKKTEQ